MVQKKSSHPRKTSAKPTAKSTSKKAVAAKKSRAQTAKSVKTQTVDYYPNRVPFYVAVLAAVILLLLSFITAL